MFSVTALVLVATGISSVAAHGGVLSYSNAGNWYWGWAPYDTPTGQTSIERPWSTYNPITDATDPQLACNDDGTSGALQLTATVEAGSAITAYWNQIWPHALGPMLTYLAACPGSTCTGVNSNTLEWVNECGLISGTVGDGSWGDGQMINQNSSWTTTIPASVPSGNYLIRFETIALHSLPAQFYPECAQINIVGGGSLAPTAAELVTFPGAYSNTDPGLDVDLYTAAADAQTSYPIPGPPLYAGAAKSHTTSTTSSSTSKSTSTTTSTSSKTSSTSSTTGGVAKYGQCGGSGYTGPTTCAAGSTCTVSNPYYSQCL
ncbi:cellulose-growth-specific protein, partial [Sistotremastrum niveocremeum HHB9708]